MAEIDPEATRNGERPYTRTRLVIESVLSTPERLYTRTRFVEERSESLGREVRVILRVSLEKTVPTFLLTLLDQWLSRRNPPVGSSPQQSRYC